MTLAITNTDISSILSDFNIALILYIMLYLTYYFFIDFSFIRKFRLKFNESEDNLEKSIYLRRSGGFILLGLIPFLVALLFFEKPITSYGIGIPSGNYLFLWFIIPTVLILLIGFLQPSKSIDTKYYPEVRKTNWDKKSIIINILFWVIYILGYEFAIRGFVFFTTLYAFGLWPAIILNSVIYSLIHIFKGSKEAYLAFLLGILFCLITYYTNSIWFAVINHILLAVINDLKAIKAAKQNNN